MNAYPVNIIGDDMEMNFSEILIDINPVLQVTREVELPPVDDKTRWLDRKIAQRGDVGHLQRNAESKDGKQQIVAKIMPILLEN